MSYCRWSSMNWRCDVYVYEDVRGGWTTHVAGRRRIVQPIPELPLHRFPRFGAKWDQDSRSAIYPTRLHRMCGWAAAWVWSFWSRRVHGLTMMLIPLREIRLLGAGETFNDPTAAACADRLELLRRRGFIVPQYAIDDLRSEDPEESNREG